MKLKLGLGIGLSKVTNPPAGGSPAFVSAEIGTVNGSTVAVTFDIVCVTAPVVIIQVNGVTITSDGGTIQGDAHVVYYVIDDGFYNNADVFTVDGNAVTNNEDIMKATITLNTAQILALPTTPQVLVPAQGANTIIVLWSAMVSPRGNDIHNIDANGYAGIGFGVDNIYISNIAANNVGAGEANLNSLFAALQNSMFVPIERRSTVWYNSTVDYEAAEFCVDKDLIFWVENNASGNFTVLEGESMALQISVYYSVLDIVV